MTTGIRRLSYEERKASDGNASKTQQPSRWVFGKGTETTSKGQAAAIFLAVAIPNCVVVGLLSDVGLGMNVYNFVASTTMSIGGDGAIFFAIVFLTFLYIFDWFYWKNKALQGITATVPVVLICCGSLLKGRKYPFAALVLTLFIIPALLGGLRSSLCASTMRRSFYRTVGICTGICSCLVLLTWIGWMYGVFGTNNQWNRTTKDRLSAEAAPIYDYIYTGKPLTYLNDCHPDHKDVTGYSKIEKPKINTACGKAASVWFLVWSSPMVAVICNAIMCVFSFVHGVMMDSAEQSDLIRALKQFLAGLMLLFAGMYCSMSFTSLAMATTIMAFMAAGMLVLCVWTFLEVGSDALINIAGESKFAQTLAKIWRSDWVRAFAVGAVNVFIPMYLLLNRLTQKVRKCRKTNGSHEGPYTEQFQWLVTEMATWNWASILTKVALLAELYFTLNVGVQKITYIFLSWLGNKLAAVPFGLVTILVFAIGFMMFMLPPVPGVPVYVFSGIVLADQGRRNLGNLVNGVPQDESGFIQGCIIAVGVSFVNKLCACCGQYAIGYFLGRSLKVQQLIKVDSVPTRALVKIVSRRGVNLGKVAVLIGAPDWPVSVGCGIARINVPQMLLGTAPVLIILSPCVLAGAFISRQGAGEDSVFPMLANIFLIFMLVAQVSAAMVGFLATMNEVQENGEELAKPRAEHAQVEELTRMEAYGNGIYKETTSWANLFFMDKAILLIMVGSHILSGGLFMFLGSMCFLPFSVDKDINAPVTDGGLGGNPINIVLHPQGSGGLFLFFLAVFCHIIHCCTMKSRSKKNLKAKPNPETSAPSQAEPIEGSQL